jgi:hypothetical protein
MLGIKELKDKIEITKTAVECPVKGCSEKVERQHRVFKKEDRFRCPKHNLFISPSTFEYPNESDNFLWKEKYDIELFEKIKRVKRESRMARDNSEDAVSWNVFRFLERNNLIEGFLSSIIGLYLKSSEAIYWSYSQKENKVLPELNEARREFGEVIRRGSEPDIIIKTDKVQFFIEAKLTAGNDTVPSNKNSSKKYESGGHNWFSRVFKSDYKTIAIIEKKYELLRFWLLGTWMAKQHGLNFYLINLVLSEREKDIENIFKGHIRETKRRKFLRITWEDIYRYISNINSSKDKNIILNYFRNKTIGYNGYGRLRRAFSINL